MIARRRRTATQRALLAYKQAAPVGIGATREQEKALADAVEAAYIQAVHDAVFILHAACQLCGGRRRDECAGLPDQMHEDPPRSATRGMPLPERFSIRICGRVCAACHRDVTEHRLRVVFTDLVRRFLAPVRAEEV